MGALHHAASRSVDRSVLLQVNRFLHSVRLTRFAATALRVALAAGFLSAVADRFGLWGMPGTPGVAWGDWSHFLTYTGRLNWFLPASLIPIVGAIATLAETALALLLLLDAWPRYTALASGVLLLLFALTMTFALGIKAPLGYSVYVGATAAFYLAATAALPQQIVTAVKCSPIVLTIGHSTRTLDEFIALLKAHAVTLVVDVRTIPRSRHNPQFNEDSLPDSLKKAGMGYVHMPGLGGLRHAKHNSVNAGWRNASFRGYADYMQTPEFEKQIEELIQLAKEHRIALMCAEAVPWRCHRSLIGDALTVRGIRTEDIMSLKLRRLHTLTPFAHVRGSTVMYPAENSSRPKKRISTGKKERTPRTQ